MDTDPEEIAEWQDALASLHRSGGPERVRQIMDMLSATARDPAIGWRPQPGTAYLNTIPADRQPPFPGDLAIEERLASLMRWNALAMVVRAKVWSATSYSELAREAREVERWNSLHPQAEPRRSHVEVCLAGTDLVVLASDYVRAWPQLIASHVRQAPFKALGTDGFGRSDTRAALRGFFEVDRHHIVLAALTALREQGRVDAQRCIAAITRYGLATDEAAPWNG